MELKSTYTFYHISKLLIYLYKGLIYATGLCELLLCRNQDLFIFILSLQNTAWFCAYIVLSAQWKFIELTIYVVNKHVYSKILVVQGILLPS